MKRILTTLLCAILIPCGAGASEFVVKFNGEHYYLANVEERNGYGLNQYVPLGETINRWTKLVALHRYDYIKASPADFANSMGEVSQLINPEAQYEVIEDPNTKESIIDFVTFTQTDPIYMEFNVFRFQDNPSTGGIQGYQYAYRLYGEDIQKRGSEIGDNRLVWRDQMMSQHHFPGYVTKQAFLNQGNPLPELPKFGF